MGKKLKSIKPWGRLFVLGFAAVSILLSDTCNVYAVTSKELTQQKEEAERQKNETQSMLQNAQDKVEDINEQMEVAEEELEEIDNQLVDLIMTVNILNQDIDNKTIEVNDAQIQYDDAVAREEKQHEAMMKRIKFMYEKGDVSYFELLLQAKSMADLVNKVDYTEKLYAYDRLLLEEYQFSKQEVYDTKLALENELSEMEELEADYKEQQEELEAIISEKRETIEDFDAKLSDARNQASVYQEQLKAQNAEIKQMEMAVAAKKAEEEAEAKKAALELAKKKAEAAAKKKTEEDQLMKMTEDIAHQGDGGEQTASESSAESSPEPAPAANPGNSSLGQEIANFACQFVGNPYVSGGTSLTNGCDCSGFTSSVYANFGISIPRTSYSQACAGREVSYSEVQPGDILYYGGHVGIYIGNNMIVHASTAATGIKISSASYRSVITIRRFV